VRHEVKLKEGPRVTAELVRSLEAEEGQRIAAVVGKDAYTGGRYEEAAGLFREVALRREFVEFLTLQAGVPACAHPGAGLLEVHHVLLCS